MLSQPLKKKNTTKSKKLRYLKLQNLSRDKLLNISNKTEQAKNRKIYD